MRRRKIDGLFMVAESDRCKRQKTIKTCALNCIAVAERASERTRPGKKAQHTSRVSEQASESGSGSEMNASFV